MSEYLLDCKLKNNLIWRAIRQQGFESVRSFCMAHGLSYGSTVNLVNLRERAVTKQGEWTNAALRLADAVQVEPDFLFTEQQRITELPTNRATVEISEKLALAMATDPYQLAVREDMAEQVRGMLEHLTDRERRVVEMRYFEGLSLEDCGRQFDVTSESIRRIEAKALRKLRHPSCSEHLLSFLDDDPLIIAPHD